MIRRWFVAVIGSGCLAVTCAGGYAWATRPATYHDAILEVLDQQHIAYTGLDVREICLPDPHCIIGDGTRTFSTIVIGRVTVHGTESYHGQLTCYDRRGDCYLYLPTLGIQRMPLRDLRSVRVLPKPLAQLWERGGIWLRGWLGVTAR